MATLRFFNEQAANASHEHIRFSFGKNWEKYCSALNESAIKHAENSFITFTQLPRLDDDTFLDLGCGSGLSSLVAHRLGAKRVLSVDIDPYSINCVTALRARFASGTDRWEIRKGSVLDRDFLASLGRFSYVYSWGVLHHTGAMWQALGNVTNCVESGGKLHTALYNEHKNSLRWLKVKRICNKGPRTVLPILKISLALLICVQLLAHFKSPVKYIGQYQENRGMTFWRDIEDWLGGLPYEYSKPDQVVDFLSNYGFMLLKLRATDSSGCNEFLFKLESPSMKKDDRKFSSCV